MKLIITGLFLMTVMRIRAQISSPGLGSDLNVCSWYAIGMREDLDTSANKRLLTYVGFGRESKPIDNNPVERPAIFVLNQEFYQKFKKHWQYSVALSFRRQNEFQEIAPYETADPGFKNEFRLYGRYMFLHRVKRQKFAAILRQEYRRFYDPHFKSWSEDLQLRTRLKGQYVINLKSDKTHVLTFVAELLFKLSHYQTPDKWSEFAYDEARLTAFYTFSPPEGTLMYSIGYMDDLTDFKNISYITLDIVIKDPFSQLKRKLTKDKEEVY